MMTVSLVTLFLLVALASLLVLADSWVRGVAAYRTLDAERTRLAAQPAKARVLIFSVWTAEHSPSRMVTRSTAPMHAAA